MSSARKRRMLAREVLLTKGFVPPTIQPHDQQRPEGELRHRQKQMKELGEILGAGWPIESAAQRMGIPVTEAYSMIRADPQLQMRIFQLRGHPINLDEVSPADQLAQIKREAMPSIFTLAYVRDNLEARLQDRLKAAEVLLKMNPDLEVTRKVEAEVIHHHVLEVPQLAGLKSIMEEIAHPSQPAIEAECVALGEKQEEE